jgi:hypothetical protein
MKGYSAGRVAARAGAMRRALGSPWASTTTPTAGHYDSTGSSGGRSVAITDAHRAWLPNDASVPSREAELSRRLADARGREVVFVAHCLLDETPAISLAPSTRAPRPSSSRCCSGTWQASLLVAALLILAGCGGDGGAERPKAAACEDVPFTANSDDIAAEIRASGVSCDEARALVRDSNGAPRPDFRGYSCTTRRVQGETVLVHSIWRCARGDAVITWKRF